METGLSQKKQKKIERPKMFDCFLMNHHINHIK